MSWSSWDQSKQSTWDRYPAWKKKYGDKDWGKDKDDKDKDKEEQLWSYGEIQKLSGGYCMLTIGLLAAIAAGLGTGDAGAARSSAPSARSYTPASGVSSAPALALSFSSGCLPARIRLAAASVGWTLL